MSVTAVPSDSEFHQFPPGRAFGQAGIGRAVSLGALGGFLAIGGLVVLGGWAGGMELSSALGFGAFAGAWSGAGFGAMMGGVSAASHTDDDSH